VIDAIGNRSRRAQSFLYPKRLGCEIMRACHALLLLAACAAAGGARAGETVFTSPSPYWQVGQRDDNLSRACALEQFGPMHPGDLLARFTGQEGPGVLDVAKGTGLNLRDPKHLAKRTEDYFFRNVGTTSCEVLVGGRSGSKPLKPAPARR